MKSKSIALLTALGLSLVAATAVAANGWTTAAVPTEVYAGYSDGSVYVKGLQNKVGCTYPLIHFSSSNSDPEKVQKLAVAAFLSGKRIACNVQGCSGSYQSGRQCKLVD